MPFTPIHFGPGAALHALAPKHISFWAFCAANVLIDLEPLYHLIHGSMRLHQEWHSYLGASVIWPLTILLFGLLRGICLLIRLPNLFGWRQLRLNAIVTGSALGSFSHVALDSIMHFDVKPFWPFADHNPMLDLLEPFTLQGLCLLAGVLGIIGAVIRGELEHD